MSVKLASVKLAVLVFVSFALFGIFALVVLSEKESVAGPPGFLTGQATVGPICPVEREGVPCPVPPEVYTSREIIVYKKDGTTVVARQYFDEKGHYRFELLEGTYVVDIGHAGVDSSGDVPRRVEIRSGETVELNVGIDTGIR